MKTSQLPFSVDIFPPHADRTSRPLAYFLSHAHRDHLVGLDETTRHRVYTTYHTSLLAAHRTRCPCATFFPLPCNKRIAIRNAVLHVTLLPVSHCPGACMFLFEGRFGTVLHTGDFRVDDRVLRSLHTLPPIDLLLLDVTYCHPDFDFPPADQARNDIVQRCLRARERDWFVFIGTDLLGKEDLLLSISIATGERIIVEPQRYQQLELVYADLAARHFCTQSSNKPAIFIVAHWQLTRHPLVRRLQEDNIAMLRILPSAHHKSDADVVHLPYSSHSSFAELREFVRQLRPQRIQATAQTSVYSAKDGRNRDGAFWFGHLLRSRSVRRVCSAPAARRVQPEAIRAFMTRESRATGATMRSQDSCAPKAVATSAVCMRYTGQRLDNNDDVLYYGLVDADGTAVPDDDGTGRREDWTGACAGDKEYGIE